MFRYMLNEHESSKVREEIGCGLFKLSQWEWLTLTYIAADKYDVVGLREVVVTGLAGLGAGCKDFPHKHYFPLKEAYGGEYPSTFSTLR